MKNKITTGEKPGTVDVVKGMFLVSCPFCSVTICCRMAENTKKKDYASVLDYIMKEIGQRMQGHVNTKHFKQKADGPKAL